MAGAVMAESALEKSRVESVTRLADEFGYSFEATGWAEEAVNLTK